MSNQAQRAYRKAVVISFIGVIVQELLFGGFLWLMAFDFTTRRFELAWVALFAVVLAAFVFAATFASVSKLLTVETAAKQNKSGAPVTKEPSSF